MRPAIRRFRLLVLVPLLGVAACSLTRTMPEPLVNPVQIGYGEADRDLVTASVSSLTATQIRQRNVASVEHLFETMPGVSVVREAGRSSLRVRSGGGTAANPEPLVVIDGIPLSRYSASNALAGVAIEDIERIDVIKDGQTAMYGVRGGRGVVLIKTRRR